jgi:phospholipid/cholesterol/gamma-HCH transport system ATP-binding protein
MQTPLIVFKNVSKQFGAKKVLDKVNLEIFADQVTTIIGKSGSGKSVTLKHIIGLIEPDEGTILFQGTDIMGLSRKERASIYHGISFMFQNNALFDSMTVFDNVAFPLHQTTHLNRHEIAHRVHAMLKQIDLKGVAEKYPAELSGGMQKRVALARALITEPKVVLFDEPTTGQDIVRRNAILSMIAHYQREKGFSAVIISHDIPDIFFISNRVLVLYEGQIVFQGTPEDLEDFDHPFVDEFLASITGLQENLTGMYSRRSFKIRYQSELSRKDIADSYVIFVFTIPEFTALCQKIGHENGQKVIKELGKYVNKHFEAVGGFSARQRRNIFITALPHSDLTEAQYVLQDFVKDFMDEKANCFQEELDIKNTSFELPILAGSAVGKSGEGEINEVIRAALKNQKEIVRIHCRQGE